MDKARSLKLYGWVGLGLTLGLLVWASWVYAQAATIHKNSFETKIGWSKGGFDASNEEIAHKIDDREPHNGHGCEYIELNAKAGSFIYYVYPVGKALITEELRTALWLRANRPGIQLKARVVLPNVPDPNNLAYRMTTYIDGDSYEQVGPWKLLEIGRPVKLAKEQQQRLTNTLKRDIDFTGAYIDALVLNIYAGPGSTKVWIDDLEIGPVVPPSALPPGVRPDNNNPGKKLTQPGAHGAVVEFNGNRLVVGNKRLFFRAVRYTDTMLAVLRNAGFNTVCFDRAVNPALVQEAADLGMWIVPELRVMNDDGSAIAPEEITKEVNRFVDNDNVLFRRLGGILAFEQAPLVANATRVARTADPGRPIAADVWDGMLPYSRSINLLGVHRWPLMTTLELPKYREWLEARKRLASPGAFTWTWIQTHLPDWYADLLYNQSPLAEFREPVGPQPEHIRLLTYTALASGCKGLAFWSDRFLADSHQGRDRLLCCALLNQEMDMLESMLVTVEDPPQWIDTSVPQVKAAVLRCAQGVLVMPIWQGKFSQFVPGQAAVAHLTMTVPQVPKTTQAWEVSPGDVRGLKVERVDKGLKVVLPEFGLTSMVVFTADTNLVGRFQDQARARRQVAAQWSYDMAMYELDKVARVQAELEQLRVTLPDAHVLLEDSRKRLQKSKSLWDARNFSEAYYEAQRALRPVRILMRAQWEKAVRGMDTPVASPYAVSFYTLPKHWALMNQVNNSTVGANVLPGGDFEIEPERRQEAWRPERQTLDDVDLVAERVTDMKIKRVEVPDPKTDEKGTKKDTPAAKKETSKGPDHPVEGRQCAMLQIKARDGKPAPLALERTLVALTSPAVKLPPGTLVQISGHVNIPTSILASPDGALMYDSIGGEALGIRLSGPMGWKKFTVYRRVPASGSVAVTLALTGIGTVYFDDIRIEPLTPANGVAYDSNTPR